MFSTVVCTIFGIQIGYLAYIIPIDEQIAFKNQPLVKNCIPVGPDDEVSRKIIRNQTHIFNLRTCQWLER